MKLNNIDFDSLGDVGPTMAHACVLCWDSMGLIFCMVSGNHSMTSFLGITG